MFLKLPSLNHLMCYHVKKRKRKRKKKALKQIFRFSQQQHDKILIPNFNFNFFNVVSQTT